MVFKHGIEPKWEDSRNHRGGRWLINVDSRNKHRLNEMWLNVVSLNVLLSNFIFFETVLLNVL